MHQEVVWWRCCTAVYIFGIQRFDFCLFSGSFPGTNHHPARKPRVAADHAGLRLLRRVPEEVRQCQRVEVLHRPVRLPAAHRAGRRTGGRSQTLITESLFYHLRLLFSSCWNRMLVGIVLKTGHQFDWLWGAEGRGLMSPAVIARDPGQTFISGWKRDISCCLSFSLWIFGDLGNLA